MIDTAAKRSSAALVGLPFRFQQPALATPGLTDSDRAAVAYLYSGFDYAGDGAGDSATAGEWIIRHRRRRGR